MWDTIKDALSRSYISLCRAHIYHIYMIKDAVSRDTEIRAMNKRMHEIAAANEPSKLQVSPLNLPTYEPLTYRDEAFS